MSGLTIEELQIVLIREAPVHKRLQAVSFLVRATRRLIWQALCLRYPEEAEEARIERFFTLLYGDLALARNAIRAANRKSSTT
ncbi:MAG: hypothetical protein JXE07_03390 [Candidatus Aminicenantes bacterium]|nr:hypothetical protein [Candidatus Aminicenantes bacterium]